MIGNKGAGIGGGIEADGGLTLKQGIVSNNATTAGGVGGGISAINGPVNVSLTTIDHNQAGGNGGGIALDAAALHMAKTTVASNSAGTGAGVFFYGSPASTVDSSTINNNTSRGTSGGGFELEFSTLDITNSTIVANQSATDGGGIYSSNSRSRPTA